MTIFEKSIDTTFHKKIFQILILEIASRTNYFKFDSFENSKVKFLNQKTIFYGDFFTVEFNFG